MNKKISLIIANYNGLDLLKKNLPYFIKECEECEFIIVDDASSDDSVKYLKQQFPQIKIILNQKNMGFGSSINRGVNIAKGEYILILNNDLIPQPGFLKPLVSVLEKNKQIFSVGSLEWESKDKLKASGKSWLKIKNGLLVHGRSKTQKEGETAWVQGGSVLLRRKEFIKLGGFDPIYSPGYWEDIDLAYRAKSAGMLNWFSDKSEVIHEHGSTFNKKYTKNEIKLLSYRNSLIFAWKNFKGIDFINHILCLPYNLCLLSIKSKGLFFISFLEALYRIITYKKLDVKHI